MRLVIVLVLAVALRAEPCRQAGTGGSVESPVVWHVAVGGDGDGTLRRPFGSIQAALDSAGPGDTVSVGPGRYAGPVRTVAGGRPGRPVTLRAIDGRGTVEITASGEVLEVNHAHVVVDGFVFDGQYGPGDVVDVKSGAAFFELRNSEVRRSGRDCIDLDGPPDVRIENTVIHHCLNPANGRADAHGVVAGPVRRLRISGCEIHTFSGDAFQVDPGRSAEGWDEVTIERTEMWLAPLTAPQNGFAAGVVPGENAIDTKASEAAPRSRLVVRDVVARGFRGGLIANMAAFNLKERVAVAIDRVTVYDSDIAFRVRGPVGGRSGAWLTASNAVVHSVNTAVRYEDNLETLRLWNSTMGRDVGRVFRAAVSSATKLDVRNLLVLGPALPRDVSGASNLAVGEGTFADARHHDYRLARGAAPVDSGVSIDAVATDRDGRPRPQGRAYDIGAYERETDPRR